MNVAPHACGDVDFIVTCEHGGHRIPSRYRYLFRGQEALLRSHRGYDPGALVMARALARAFAAPLVKSTTSRLLVDLNRSTGHPRLFSTQTRGASSEVRARIIAHYYRPYRTEVQRLVQQAIARGRRVVHISSHSFTPELNGTLRVADVGLLYHPGRPAEVDLCERWKSALETRLPALRVRRNYPYAGKGDGLVTHLRRSVAPDAYIGVELEVNQRIVFQAGRGWAALQAGLVDSLRAAAKDNARIQVAAVDLSSSYRS